MKRNILLPQHDPKMHSPLGRQGRGRCAPFYDDLGDALESAPCFADKRFGNAQDIPEYSTFGEMKTRP